MPLPDTCCLLEVARRHLIIAIGLGLGQIALLQELFDQEEKHSWIAGEKVFNLVQGHIFGMAWRFERSFDEII